MSSGLLEEPGAGSALLFVPLKVDQLDSMVREGILSDEPPVELIDGFIVYRDRSGTGEDPMVVNPRHTLVVELLQDALQQWARSCGHYVRAQVPVTLTQFSQPFPDIAVVTGTSRTYGTRNPGGGDISVVIEVADSSLRRDRTIKHRLYASAGIPVYWIVNLVENQIEVYDRPTPGLPKYGQCQIYSGDEIVSLCIDDQTVELKVSELLS